ncbi:helix-turn-helix domain-containing protein [Rheinheimera baltica]|uniref:Helix-turn-helix domain-containing protein n=1 Tax=Rheinheimera baltica TaxID=67576 RepID=A0ABT9HX21_9GAMM|nr:helix-turn-helix domain-containing protein [Rheinheimera baltica]MDP5135686.1 helix-turn-helix domain-containing protein [Rheinheimera baltica]
MITVGIFIYPDIQALDLAGALDCFGQANQELLAAGRAPYYRYCVIGLNTAPLFAENGLQLTAQYSLDTCPQLDYLVIPGGAGARTLTANQDFIRWLCQRSTETEKIISICTGAYLLAQSGLVDGLPLATHWRFAADLQTRYPKVQVNSTELYVNSGKFYSSGGMTAGIDLCLAVIEQDHGVAIAQAVAQELVMYLRRSGDQSQYASPLKIQHSGVQRFIQLQHWLLANLTKQLTVADMAEQVALSERQFRRVFRARFAMTPVQYLQQLRLDKARSLMLCDGYSLQRICNEVGISDPRNLIRLFNASFGCTPGEYRQHFC